MISVIIPVYNARPHLAKCLNSLKAQFFRDWECIIVNDGSTDGSLDELLSLTEGDARFNIISKKVNEGVSAARNTGMEQARGDLFFLDADDWLERGILGYLSVEAGMHPEAGRIVALSTIHYNKHGWVLPWSIQPKGTHGPDSPFLFSGQDCDPGHVTGSLYVRDRIPGGMLFPQVKMFEDMIFNMGMMFAGTSTFISDKYLYHYNRSDSSLITQPLSVQDTERARMALADLADRYNPKADTLERCRLFLENAMNNKLKDE